MKVRIHKLFQYLLETTEAEPEAIVGFSLATSPTLGDFLDDLDPALPLDWNRRSFRGLPGAARACAGAGRARPSMQARRRPDHRRRGRGELPRHPPVARTGRSHGHRDPGWPQAEVLGRGIGARISTVARVENDGWRLPLDRLAEAVTPDTKLIFLSNPNNPTGRLMGEDELARVVEIAERAGAWLLVDEVYAGLEWDGPRAPSVAGLYSSAASPPAAYQRRWACRGCAPDG
jgi:hypothetical protein